MSVRTTITNKGLQLLASSSQATGQYYWLGYYGLAYVPDFWKTNTTIDFPDPECFQVNEGTEILPTDIDPVTPTMQRLTTYGDMVWNVWQGDLTGTGFISESDGTPGGDLFGLTMYGENVKKHYRYVLDENGNNLLVCWINDPVSTTGNMLKQTTYLGTDGFVRSELPIPAPLYYLGDVTGKLSVNNFFPDFDDSDENGSSIYPFIEVDSDNAGVITIPTVSADYRGYLDTLGNGSNAIYAPTISGSKFDSTEIPIAVDPTGFDVTGWYAANLTYEIPESTATLNNTPAKFDTEFWKLYTSSNYNRWHAPVDNMGFILNSDLANRNMAKTTKFFPISNYKTISTESGFTSSGSAVEVATAIQLTIDLDISPTTVNDGSEESQITSFDKYANADGPAENPPSPSSPVDQFGNSVYRTTHSSMKFNRIGIYAVPLRKNPCVQDQGFGSVPPTSSSCANVSGSAVELQFQIDPDEEPVLFAVMDWDNTVTLDDTGNGLSAFHAEVNVNLESPDGSVDDTALIRDCTIFYNLYEDDALKWYQNQLIANAQTQNAVTELGLEVNSLLNRSSDSDCCPSPDLSELYASRNHVHAGLGLRNLKDSGIAADNGLRGIATINEGTEIIAGAPYKLGLQSVALGLDTAAIADNSFASGIDNIVHIDAVGSFIAGGTESKIQGISKYSTIISGKNNEIMTSQSTIISGEENKVTDSNYGGILASTISTMSSSSHNSLILGTVSAEILASERSVVIGGNNNNIGGLVGSGNDNGNVIIGSDESKVISTGVREAIRGGVYSSYSSGLYESQHSAILASNTSNIIFGRQCVIIASDNVAMNDADGDTFSNNIAVIARSTTLGNTITDNTLYTDNFNFVGDMTANNTNGTEDDILTIYGGKPQWRNNSSQFNWVDITSPGPNGLDNGAIINEWDVQYALVGDMVYLRGEMVISGGTTQETLKFISPLIPAEAMPSKRRLCNLFSTCNLQPTDGDNVDGAWQNVLRVDTDGSVSLNGLKRSGGSVLNASAELISVDSYGKQSGAINFILSGSAYPL